MIGNTCFYYVKRWSDVETWGKGFGDLPPQNGESFWVPKGLNLLMDVDSPPKLELVTIEGTLIFLPDPDPDHLRTFDVDYIMIKGGVMIAGTADAPYTSRLEIRLHGEERDSVIPLFGNKVIAVYEGRLEMHG